VRERELKKGSVKRVRDNSKELERSFHLGKNGTFSRKNETLWFSIFNVS